MRRHHTRRFLFFGLLRAGKGKTNLVFLTWPRRRHEMSSSESSSTVTLPIIQPSWPLRLMRTIEIRPVNRKTDRRLRLQKSPGSFRAGAITGTPADRYCVYIEISPSSSSYQPYRDMQLRRESRYSGQMGEIQIILSGLKFFLVGSPRLFGLGQRTYRSWSVR